jgi:uncharacterized protein involved in exopolysaccharide biosynthesis
VCPDCGEANIWGVEAVAAPAPTKGLRLLSVLAGMFAGLFLAVVVAVVGAVLT